MTDLIKRDDARAACDIAPPDEWNDYTKDGYNLAADDCKRGIAALPAIDPAAVTVGVKPLNQFGVRELARAAGISPTTAMRVKRGEGDLDGATLRAVLAATKICLCCGKELQPIDPAAIREAALREAAEVAQRGADILGGRMRDAKDKKEKRDWQSMLLAAVDIKDAILALIGEKK